MILLSPQSSVYRLLRIMSWPALMILCCSITAYGFSMGSPMLYFNLAYLFLIISLFFLERAMPFERAWQKPDGQTFASIAHTLSSKGTVQLLLFFGGTIGLLELLKPLADQSAGGLWPRDWPLVLQVILGLVVAEFMLYWAHRLGHEVPFFWRFHAVHHSVTKLWFVNTGRFHFLDSLKAILMGILPLVILGAPIEIIQWMSAITAFIGMLTHCNVDMTFGPLSYIFNTPELHRWHHSKILREGNRNYGENLMLWDQIFGTFTNLKDRRPPADIGMKDYMPPKFWQQLLWPLLSNRMRKMIIAEYTPLEFIREEK